MMYSFKPVALGLVLLGLVSTGAFAASSNSSASQIDKINTQTQALEAELAKLRSEVRGLKAEVKVEQVKQTVKQRKRAAASSQVGTHSPTSSDNKTTSYVPAAAAAPADSVENSTVILDPDAYMPFDIYVPGQSFVSTGPYIGVPLQFAGSNLIINNPSINQDVVLLKLRSDIRKEMAARGTVDDSERHSHLLLSGVIEGQIDFGKHNTNNNVTSSSDINLANVSIDGFLMGPTDWTSGYFELSYRDGVDPNLTNYRAGNSQVFLNKAFIVLGNFDKSPVYSSLGQMYVPFGTYSSQMISSPLTKYVGRTKARALLLGYQPQTQDAFYASTYIFRGDSYDEGNNSRINNGGINVGFRFDKGFVVGNVGAGIIANIADAGGMQYTGDQPLFNGFGGPTGYGSEQLSHRVPAYNVRGLVSIGGHLDLLAELISATTSFNYNDLSYNAHGAKPLAFNTEAAYSFSLFEKPSSIGVGYSQANQALALGIPHQRYGAVFNTSLWRNTIQSLEVRHDAGFGSGNTSSGSTIPGPNGGSSTDNVVTTQFDYYF